MLLTLSALSALTDLARLLGLGAGLLANLFAGLLARALADDGAVRVVVELELAIRLGLGCAL